MTIPSNITTELTTLQAQIAAATPLTKASRATVIALQLNAAQLVVDVDAAQVTSAGALDTWIAPTDPVQIINGMLGVLGNAIDDANLAYMRGIAGRVASNLDQLGPTPRNPPIVTPLPFRAS